MNSQLQERKEMRRMKNKNKNEKEKFFSWMRNEDDDGGERANEKKEGSNGMQIEFYWWRTYSKLILHKSAFFAHKLLKLMLKVFLLDSCFVFLISLPKNGLTLTEFYRWPSCFIHDIFFNVIFGIFPFFLAFFCLKLL